MKTFEEIAEELFPSYVDFTHPTIRAYAIACMKEYRDIVVQELESMGDHAMPERAVAYRAAAMLMETLGDSKEKKNL